MFYINKYVYQFHFKYDFCGTVMSDVNLLKWLQQLHRWSDEGFTPVVFSLEWKGSTVQVCPAGLYPDVREYRCFSSTGCRVQEEPSNGRYQTSTAGL